MKRIFFVRHGKSDWSDLRLSDHDRPLAARGKRDAPRMAARLAELGYPPDGILTSTAKRARATAKVFREVLGIPKSRVIREKGLYLAAPREIEEHLTLRLPPEWNTVLLFGHNPGYTDLANALKNEYAIENVPTCGIFGCVSDVKEWADWRIATARRTQFLYPKQDR